MNRSGAIGLASLLGLGALALVGPARAEPSTSERVRVRTVREADRVLRPGDVFLELGAPGRLAVRGFVSASQAAMKALFGLGNRKIWSGGVALFHAGIYLGRGRCAEANGRSAKVALVTQFPLAAHGGSTFKVYRPKDPALAARAARIARRWANGQMGYRLPLHLPFTSSWLGPRSRAEALRFARGADRVGGPEGFEKMFCSQFVGAVYQAAALGPQLARRPKLRASGLRFPEGLRFHASNVSPMTLDGHLKASLHWRLVGEVKLDMKTDEGALDHPGR